MEALTPASPDSLPPLGGLIADEPFWRFPLGAMAGEGVAHLRVWLTPGAEPGYLAVVTETGSAAPVTESAGDIWAVLARRYGPFCCAARALPGTRDGGRGGDPQPGPHRRRRQRALAACVADLGGQSASRRAGALDGRSRPPDRQQARGRV